VRRAELLQLHGAWPEALEGAQRATEWLSNPAPKPGIGSAFYQMGEVHRLRGKFADAEDAYRQAGQWLRSFGPGPALLRLAQGAVPELTRRSGGSQRRRMRPARAPESSMLMSKSRSPRMMSPVPAVLAMKLAGIAAGQDIPFLRASCRATGAVLLAEADAPGALAPLRQSWSLWSDLQAPYEAARVRYLPGLAFGSWEIRRTRPRN
jgi:hypothetical protein